MHPSRSVRRRSPAVGGGGGVAFGVDGEELRKKLARLARAERVDAQPAAAARIEPRVLRVAKRAHQQKEIGIVLVAENVLAFLVHLAALAAGEQIARLRERRQQAPRAARIPIPARPAASGRNAGAPETRASGGPWGRDRARRAVERAQIPEQVFRAVERSGAPAVPASGRRGHPSTPLALSVSTTSARSSRRTSGVSCAGRSACSASVQRRRQWPGAVRPARPARWSAEARLIFSTRSVLMPRYGSNRAMRACPESITRRTPSMVSEVSATLVLTTTLRWPG